MRIFVVIWSPIAKSLFSYTVQLYMYVYRNKRPLSCLLWLSSLSSFFQGRVQLFGPLVGKLLQWNTVSFPQERRRHWPLMSVLTKLWTCTCDVAPLTKLAYGGHLELLFSPPNETKNWILLAAKTHQGPRQPPARCRWTASKRRLKGHGTSQRYIFQRLRASPGLDNGAALGPIPPRPWNGSPRAGNAGHLRNPWGDWGSCLPRLLIRCDSSQTWQCCRRVAQKQRRRFFFRIRKKFVHAKQDGWLWFFSLAVLWLRTKNKATQ